MYNHHNDISNKENERLANIKKELLDQEFRDAVGTISKEGKRNYIFPQKPFGKLYNLRSYFSYFYLVLFFTLPFIKIEGEPMFLFNVLERKFIFFWTGFLASRLFYIRHRITDFLGFCYSIYSCIWKVVLWLGLSSNDLHGNGIQKN